jgi:hypothetical protein
VERPGVVCLNSGLAGGFVVDDAELGVFDPGTSSFRDGGVSELAVDDAALGAFDPRSSILRGGFLTEVEADDGDDDDDKLGVLCWISGLAPVGAALPFF